MLSRLGNGETGKILRGMCIAVFCKGFSVVFSYLLNFALAKMLGSHGLGLFSLAFAIVVSASFLGRFGLDYVLLRHAALCASSGQMGVLAAWSRQANLLAGGVALALTLCLAIFGHWFCTEVFGKSELYLPLIAMLLTPFVGASLETTSRKSDTRHVRNGRFIADPWAR